MADPTKTTTTDNPDLGTTVVRHCAACDRRTWHYDGRCEWSDKHAAPVTNETPKQTTVYALIPSIA